MTGFFLTPVLAAGGFHEILGIVFVIISILSYFVSAIRGNEEIVAAKKNPKKNGNQGVSDLEEFLRQVVEQKQETARSERRESPSRAENTRTRETAERDQRSEKRLESSSTRNDRNDRNDRNNRAKMKAKQRQPVRRGSTEATPEVVPSEVLKPVGQGVASTHLPKHELGTVKNHLSSYMATRVSQEAAAHLNQTEAGRALSRGMGTSAFATPEGVLTEHPLVALLRTSEGARNAIVVREILDRPRAFQKR